MELMRGGDGGRVGLGSAREMEMEMGARIWEAEKTDNSEAKGANV